MKFSAATLALTGALGVLVGTLITDRGPRVASAHPAPEPQLAPPAANDGKQRIIVFGAHPDDAEYRGAGVAIKWAKAGHHVKLVSATNGDIGHWESAGGPLASRRLKEVQAVAKAMGVHNEVLDIHDGEIMPTLENRRTITRLIREWNADVVIVNRPNDYHPDHRYTSILVQDSAYMVGVPFFTPNVPPLKRNPVYFYTNDRFQRPNPFRADVAVGIDEVVEPMLNALLLMESQIHEGGADGRPGIYPSDAAGKKKRQDEVRTNLARRYEQQANNYREALIKFYGPEKGKAIKYAQAFEICEYGRQPSQADLKQIFPF
jgi:LmbE family N-acetylglucosaminyl deacetylase